MKRNANYKRAAWPLLALALVSLLATVHQYQANQDILPIAMALGAGIATSTELASNLELEDAIKREVIILGIVAITFAALSVICFIEGRE